MRNAVALLLLGLGWVASPAHAKPGACRARFEIAAPSGAPLAVRRATKSAAAGRCDFAVRLRIESLDESALCHGAQVTMRGMAASAAAGASQGSWQQVSLSPRGRRTARRLLRARVAGAGSARLLLRCAARAQIAGCEAPSGESVACYVGGDTELRIVGLDSGQVCRGSTPPDDEGHGFGVFGTNLAIWSGRAWTCLGDSTFGAFVSTPVNGGASGRVAGPCRATATDGESLLVLPLDTFDMELTPLRASRRRPFVLAGPGPSDPTRIRAYDVPDAIPTGPYREVFDLDDIPVDSPCAGLTISTMTAHDGVVYAAGFRRDAFGVVFPEPRICVFDTRTGAVLSPLTLEGFVGEINGMSAIEQGRLIVLSGDAVSLPAPGYLPAEATSSPGSSAALDQLHVFDAATGARLDSRTIDTSQATGLACFPRNG